jgi:hypothetical protein
VGLQHFQWFFGIGSTSFIPDLAHNLPNSGENYNRYTKSYRHSIITVRMQFHSFLFCLDLFSFGSTVSQGEKDHTHLRALFWLVSQGYIRFTSLLFFWFYFFNISTWKNIKTTLCIPLMMLFTLG